MKQYAQKRFGYMPFVYTRWVPDPAAVAEEYNKRDDEDALPGQPGSKVVVPGIKK